LRESLAHEIRVA
jgi:hypothetical protein